MMTQNGTTNETYRDDPANMSTASAIQPSRAVTVISNADDSSPSIIPRSSLNLESGVVSFPIFSERYECRTEPIEGCPNISGVQEGSFCPIHPVREQQGQPTKYSTYMNTVSNKAR